MEDCTRVFPVSGVADAPSNPNTGILRHQDSEDIQATTSRRAHSRRPPRPAGRKSLPGPQPGRCGLESTLTGLNVVEYACDRGGRSDAIRTQQRGDREISRFPGGKIWLVDNREQETHRLISPQNQTKTRKETNQQLVCHKGQHLAPRVTLITTCVHHANSLRGLP